MDELIEALRHCTNDLPCSTESYKCGYIKEWNCMVKIRLDAADAIERLTKERKEIKDKLIERICANCDTPPETRLRICGECPIISPIREAFE